MLNMSRRDAEILAFEEWLHQLGCPSQPKPEEAQRLLAPHTRSIWRHLQTYVKPVRSVQTIRKNLLLAKLQRENIRPDQIGNFKIQSREDLILVKKVSDIQQKTDSKTNERKVVDKEIESLRCKIAEEKYKIICKENEIKEMEDKTTLLNLKLPRVQKDIEKLIKDTSKAIVLETIKTSDLYREESSNVSNIATALMRSNLTPHKSVCKEDKALLFSLSKDYPMKTVYQAFLLASDSISKSLKRFSANLESPEEDMKETLASSGALSFSDHLKHLNTLIIQNELDLVNNVEKVKGSSAELEREKIELIKCIKGICINNCTDTNDDDWNVMVEGFVDKLVDNSVSSKRTVTLKEVMGELEAECVEHDHLNKLVCMNREREIELLEEVKRKVDLINELYAQINKYVSKVDHVKARVIQSCSESLSTFLTDINKQKEHEDELEHIITNEIKMLIDVPLSALTRRWENAYELLPSELINELSTNPELRIFLLQSEPKNIVKSVLEKKWWLCSLVEK